MRTRQRSVKQAATAPKIHHSSIVTIQLSKSRLRGRPCTLRPTGRPSYSAGGAYLVVSTAVGVEPFTLVRNISRRTPE